MTADPILLILALLSLAIGLCLYWWVVHTSKSEYFATTNVICWLLIALFPVLIIFAFFPSSSFGSNLTGFSMGGAVGAFIFIWIYGTKIGARAALIDEQKARISELEADVKRYRDLADTKRKPIKLDPSQSRTYKINSSGKFVTLFTGDTGALKAADIWVSSENTNMQMARFYDLSISGTVRYLGAKKESGIVIEDIIAQELKNFMTEKNLHYVEAATVLMTGSGDLLKTNNVKKIFHAAAVRGDPGAGYQPVRNVQNCVTNSLLKADSEDLRDQKCETIAFPLFGTGTARSELEPIVKPLLESAIFYLSENPASQIQHVYFLTWRDLELELCIAVLEKDKRVTLV
jgi:O-acetyl-ADP-ribose deacetylase (regulator of RNase III)